MRYTKDNRLSSMLKNRLEVWGQGFSDERNRLGQKSKVDKKLFDVWGSIVPQTGTLLAGRQADTALTKTTHKIITRYNKNITNSNWFVYDGQRYNIIYVMNPYLDNERLEIFCEIVL